MGVVVSLSELLRKRRRIAVTYYDSTFEVEYDPGMFDEELLEAVVGHETRSLAEIVEGELASASGSDAEVAAQIASAIVAAGASSRRADAIRETLVRCLAAIITKDETVEVTEDVIVGLGFPLRNAIYRAMAEDMAPGNVSKAGGRPSKKRGSSFSGRS